MVMVVVVVVVIKVVVGWWPWCSVVVARSRLSNGRVRYDKVGKMMMPKVIRSRGGEVN